MKTLYPKISLVLSWTFVCLIPLMLNGQEVKNQKPNGLNSYHVTSVNGFRVAQGHRPPIDHSQLPADAFETGRVRLKITPNAQKSLQGKKLTSSQSGTSYARTGMAAVDKLNEEFGVTAYKPVLAEFNALSRRLNTQSDRHQAWGFHLWYELEIDSESDVLQAVKKFGALMEVDHAEPVYSKRKIGNIERHPSQSRSDIDFKWTPNDPQFNKQWQYHNTGQSNGTKDKDIHLVEAWDLERGHPDVIVAIIDDGIQFDHPDLADNMWAGLGYNFMNNSSDIVPGEHGTHVAGTVAAVNNNGTGVSGIAGGSGTGDGIRLMSCQVFSDWGSGGFELAPIYAADNGAAISQNSWGYTSPGVYEEIVLDAIDYFNTNGGGDVLNGGITIYASGNDDSSEDFYPGYYQGTLSVAATNNQDQKAWYSNYGSWVDISAPGGETITINETGILSTLTGSSYEFYQGTSMACPHVSGVAALLISYAHRQGIKIENSELWDLLLNNADDHYAENQDYIGQLGAGRLNANSSLMAIDELLNGVRRPIRFSAASFSTSQINLTWDKNDDANDVMIAYSADGFLGWPTDGVLYVVGDALPDGGEVVYLGSDTEFSHMDLDPSTEYFYRAFSFNSDNEYSSGHSASAYTLCDAQALPYFESFESGMMLPLCWSMVDNDGDQKNWGMGGTSYNPQDGSVVAISASIDNFSGNLAPDNWLVSPKFLMTSNTVLLKFFVKALDASFPNENYSVMVSRGGSELEVFTEVFTETLQDANWKQVVVQLDGYLNEEIYIAFRHWNCTAQSQLVIDNISIEEYELRNLTLNVNPENAGVVSGGGDYYNGQVVTVSAETNPGYIFENWTLNEEVVSTDASFDFTIPTHEVVLVAHFTDKIPALSIAPEFIDEFIYSGNSVTRSITLTNTGDEGSSLNVTIEAGNINHQNHTSQKPELIYSVPKNIEHYHKGHDVAEDSNVSFTTNAALTEGASVLYLNTKGGLDLEFRSALQNLENVGSYSELSAINHTPNVDYLLDYDLVMVSSGSTFSNATLLGDNLADYVDAGGRVCLLPGSFFQGGGYTLQGRIMTEAYAPLSTADYAFTNTNSTSFIEHPITSNVSQVSTLYWSSSIVQGAGVSLGDFESGSPVGAYNSEKSVVAINIDVYDGAWSGDFMQMIQNTIDWLMDSNWLDVNQEIVSIPWGESHEFEVILDATSLVEGVYESHVHITSNDPEKAVVNLPVNLEVAYEQFALNISVNPLESGVVTGGGSYYENEKVKLVASPNDGFMFVNWTLNEELLSTSDSLSFVMPGHEVELVANFTDQIPEITVDPHAINANVFSGHTLTDVLTIGNSGLGNLVYDIEIIPVDRGMDSEKASQSTIVARPASVKGVFMPDVYSDSPMTNGGGPDEYGYSWTVLPIDWMDATSGTAILLGDDSYVSSIPIGFDFDYYGETYSEINVMSNGWVSFSSLSNWFPNCVPNSEISGAIVPFGIDLHPGSGGNVYYQTQGQAPNRHFIIEFNNIRIFGSSVLQTFQVVFQEQTGNILFQYLVASRPPEAIGIASSSGTGGMGNCGNGDLFINPNIVQSNTAIAFSNLNTSWLSLSSYSGSVFSEEEDQKEFLLDATNLNRGFYEALLRITSNDPQNSVLDIPVSLQVDYERFALTVSTNPTESGVVVGEGDYYENEVVILEASPNDGFMFVNWTLNEELLSTIDSLAFVMPGHEVELVANFTDQIPEITVTPNPMSQNIYSGETLTDLLTISNTGLGNLVYDIEIIHAEGGPDSVKTWQPQPATWPKFEKGSIAPDIYSESPMTTGGGPDEYGYSWTVLPIDWMDASSGTAIPLGDDSYESSIPIGFDFHYYGETFSEINIMSNGWVSFTSLGNGLPSCVPYSEFGGAIAPLSMDLDPRSGGNIYYQTQGLAPNRRFIIEYNDIRMYNSSISQTFQVILHEQTGVLLFQYLIAPQVPHSIGVESPSGMDGLGSCGGGDLFINPNIVQSNMAIKFSHFNTNWLSLSSVSGSVLSTEEDPIDVTFNATNLNEGLYELLLRITSNDPNTPIVDVPISMDVTGAPIISFSHSSVEFGVVSTGRAHAIPVTITNKGTANLLVTNILTSDSLFTVSASELEVPINEERELLITFQSPATGAFEATLSFETNIPANPEFSISLSAQALSPATILAEPDSVYETIGFDEIVERVITLTNIGGMPLEFSASLSFDQEIEQGSKFTDMIDLGTKTFEGMSNLGEQSITRNDHIRYNKGTSGDTSYNILIYEEVPSYYWYFRALSSLSLDYTSATSWDALAFAINGGIQWDLVLVNSYFWPATVTATNALTNYLNGGGKLIFAHWKGDDFSSLPLSQIMGINVVSNIETPINFRFTPESSIFSHPNELPDEFIWGDMHGWMNGQIVEALDGAERLAIFNGYPNSAAVVLNATRNSLFNAFQSDNYAGDYDDSGEADILELIENQITYMLQNNYGVSPSSGIVAGGESIDLTLTFNSEGLAEGLYHGRITIVSADSITPEYIVPVTMEVLDKRFKLTIQTVGDGLVEVGGIPYTEVVTVDPNTVISLAAFPSEGWFFETWGQEVSSNVPAIRVTMDEDKTITANFMRRTSIDNNGLSPVNVYPNPFSSSITIDSANEVKKVIITNTIGVHLIEVESSYAELITIHTEELKEGVYLITLFKQNGESEVRKMVKKR